MYSAALLSMHPCICMGVVYSVLAFNISSLYYNTFDLSKKYCHQNNWLLCSSVLCMCNVNKSVTSVTTIINSFQVQ